MNQLILLVKTPPHAATSLSLAKISHGGTDHLPLLEIFGLIKLRETKKTKNNKEVHEINNKWGRLIS